jgi:hypothetical protein
VQRLELAAFRQGVAKKTRSVIGTNSKWNIDRKEGHVSVWTADFDHAIPFGSRLLKKLPSRLKDEVGKFLPTQVWLAFL